jgi:hypothetical protein
MGTKDKSKTGRINPQGCLLAEYSRRQWNKDKDATLDWYAKYRANLLRKKKLKRKEQTKETVKETVKESPKPAKTAEKVNLGGGNGLMGFQNFMRANELKRGAASKKWKAMTTAEKNKWSK